MPLALMALLAIFLVERPLDPIGTHAPGVTMDSLKAEREKQDREKKKDTKRPWDGMDLTGPNALKKKQPVEESTGQGDRRDR